MREASRAQLEAEWQNIDASYSYSDWEARRQNDWQRVISQRRPDLGKSVAVDSGLFTYLQSHAVFDRRTIETFKQETGAYAQVSSTLHALEKQSFTGFVSFCQCLIETGQTAIIVDFLTPELDDLRLRQRQRDQPPPSLNVDVRQVPSDDAASLEVFSVVELRPPASQQGDKASSSMPAVVHAAGVVNYDWKTVIRENFMLLTQYIDPDYGLLNHLQSHGVINHVSADVIKSKKGRANRVIAILDHVTQFRPDGDFVKLCDALTATGQEHIVRHYLAEDAVRASAAESAELLTRRPATWSTQSNIVDSWRSVLTQHRSSIIDVLDSSEELVDRLVAYGAMNFTTGELCREEPDVVVRSEFILDHMQRRASRDMVSFCQALEDTAQQHIIREFFQQSTTVDDSAATN